MNQRAPGVLRAAIALLGSLSTCTRCSGLESMSRTSVDWRAGMTCGVRSRDVGYGNDCQPRGARKPGLKVDDVGPLGVTLIRADGRPRNCSTQALPCSGPK